MENSGAGQKTKCARGQSGCNRKPNFLRQKQKAAVQQPLPKKRGGLSATGERSGERSAGEMRGEAAGKRSSAGKWSGVGYRSGAG